MLVGDEKLATNRKSSASFEEALTPCSPCSPALHHCGAQVELHMNGLTYVALSNPSLADRMVGFASVDPSRSIGRNLACQARNKKSVRDLDTFVPRQYSALLDPT